MNALGIRSATPEDAAAAVDCLRRSITELCVLDHQHDAPTLDRWLSNKTQEHFVRWLADPNNQIVIAHSDLAVAGVADLHSSGEIRLCYVHPSFTRAGAGRLLLTTLEARARLLGLERLTLRSSLTACPFYEHLGYASAGEAIDSFGVLRGYPYAKSL